MLEIEDVWPLYNE